MIVLIVTLIFGKSSRLGTTLRWCGLCLIAPRTVIKVYSRASLDADSIEVPLRGLICLLVVILSIAM